MKLLGSFGSTLDPQQSTTTIPPGDYTNTWFDSHIRYWETLTEWAAEQRKDHGGLRFLEIGVFDGRSAAWVMKNLFDPADIGMTLVDPWGPGPEWEHIYQRAIKNVNVLGLVLPKVMRMSSWTFWQDHSDKVAPNGYDFIYVDGSHKANDVEVDILAAWGRLRPGGIILADDYYNPGTPGEERSEVEKGLMGVHQKKGWVWPPARFGIDVLYQRVD